MTVFFLGGGEENLEPYWNKPTAWLIKHVPYLLILVVWLCSGIHGTGYPMCPVRILIEPRDLEEFLSTSDIIL